MEITVEHRLQRRAKGLVKRVRFIKVPLSRVFQHRLFSDEDSKAVHKKAYLVKLKDDGCSLLKRSAYYAAIGCKIVISD